MNCKECEHYQNQTCIWNYDYLDTDYAYDCCDFIHIYPEINEDNHQVLI